MIEDIEQDRYWRIWQNGHDRGFSDGRAQGESIGWQKGWQCLKDRILARLRA